MEFSQSALGFCFCAPFLRGPKDVPPPSSDSGQEEYAAVNAQNVARVCHETIRCAEEIHREAWNHLEKFGLCGNLSPV